MAENNTAPSTTSSTGKRAPHFSGRLVDAKKDRSKGEFWEKVGVAFNSRNGGLNLLLDQPLPKGAKLYLSPIKPR